MEVRVKEAVTVGLMRQGTAAVFLAVLAAQAVPGAWAQAKRPSINEFVADWFLAGTAIPTYQSLLLSPGSPSRGGFIWRLSPLDTHFFDIIMTFTARKPEKRSVNNDGFAFWYVAENGSQALQNLTRAHAHNQEEIIAGTWDKEFVAGGFDLMGYRNNFKGLGVFFTDGNESSVSIVTNDGTKELKLGADIPTKDAVKLNWASSQPLKLKMKAKPGLLVVELEGHHAVTIEAPPIVAGGYLGLTSFVGPGEPPNDPSATSCIIELKELEIMSKDPNSKLAEDVKVVPEAKARSADQIAEDVLHETSKHKEHRAESDAIKDLTNMVFKLVVETQPVRAQMTKAIESLGKRIGAMEKNFNELKAELDKKTGHKLAAEFEAIKKELTHLSASASSSSHERHKRLEALHSDIADVHKSAHSPDVIDKHLDKLTQSNSKVLDKLTSEHQMMFGVSIAAIAFIIIAGLSLYNKFRCWEKKHIL